MTITQTVEIPADRRLVIEVPREVPTGRAMLTFTTMTEAAAEVRQSSERGLHPPAEADRIEFADAANEDVMAAGDEILSKHLAAFKALAE